MLIGETKISLPGPPVNSKASNALNDFLLREMRKRPYMNWLQSGQFTMKRPRIGCDARTDLHLSQVKGIVCNFESELPGWD